jgi:hypothetical protein
MKMFTKIKIMLTHFDWSRFVKSLEITNTLLGLAAFMCVASWALDREIPVRNVGQMRVGIDNTVKAGGLYRAEITYELLRKPIDCSAAIDFSLFDSAGTLLPGGVHSFHTATAFAESASLSPGVFPFFIDVPAAIKPDDIRLAGSVRYSCGNNVLQYIMPLTLEYKSSFKVVP